MDGASNVVLPDLQIGGVCDMYAVEIVSEGAARHYSFVGGALGLARRRRIFELEFHDPSLSAVP